jgi:hypothetical protein
MGGAAAGTAVVVSLGLKPGQLWNSWASCTVRDLALETAFRNSALDFGLVSYRILETGWLDYTLKELPPQLTSPRPTNYS